MRLLTPLFLCFLLLSTVCSAQTPEQQAKETAKIINQLYSAADSEFGAYLFEPELVLCFGGKLPATSQYSYELVGDPNISELNKLARPLGARISTDEENFFVESKIALGVHTNRSKLSWVTPFDSSGDWESFEAWLVQTKDSLRKVDSASSAWELRGFLQGYPDSAIESEREFRSDRTKRRTAVSSRFAYGDFLEGEDPNFDIAPSHITSPDSWERYQEASQFLGAFYNLPEVRTRLNSPLFLDRRRKIRKGDFLPETEEWLRGKSGYSLLERRSHFSMSFPSERILAAHADELIQMIEEKTLTGPEIGDKIRDWGLESTPKIAIELEALNDWIWSGGYGFGSYRDRVYQSFKKNHPQKLANLTKRKLDSWLKESPKKEYPPSILSLFSHSGTKEYFSTLDQATKDKIRARMENAAFDRDVRILLGQPPYSL